MKIWFYQSKRHNGHKHERQKKRLYRYRRNSSSHHFPRIPEILKQSHFTNISALKLKSECSLIHVDSNNDIGRNDLRTRIASQIKRHKKELVSTATVSGICLDLVASSDILLDHARSGTTISYQVASLLVRCLLDSSRPQAGKWVGSYLACGSSINVQKALSQSAMTLSLSGFVCPSFSNLFFLAQKVLKRIRVVNQQNEEVNSISGTLAAAGMIFESNSGIQWLQEPSGRPLYALWLHSAKQKKVRVDEHDASGASGVRIVSADPHFDWRCPNPLACSLLDPTLDLVLDLGCGFGTSPSSGGVWLW